MNYEKEHNDDYDDKSYDFILFQLKFKCLLIVVCVPLQLCFAQTYICKMPNKGREDGGVTSGRLLI